MDSGKIICTILATALMAATSASLSGDAKTEPSVWSWTWDAAPGDAPPEARICPVQYGKDWCYSVEMDDGGVSALVMDELLSKLHYTDAPPGVKGGATQRFVGSVALIGGGVGGNSAGLSWEQVKELQKKGWGVADHGYWHTGCHWDLSKRPSSDQFERELYWCQTIMGHELFDGRRSVSHHVYPNGDPAYGPFLEKYGVFTASHVGGKDYVIGDSPKGDVQHLARTYLDEGSWKKGGKEDPMAWFPKPEPEKGRVFIDFTHGIDKDPESANYKRWAERLAAIAKDYGAEGKDNVWAGTVQEFVAYDKRHKASNVSAGKGSVEIKTDSAAPGSRLTVRLDGVPEGAKLKAPDGGVLHRSGTTVWLTTPMLGEPGSPMPKPEVRRIYKGAFKEELSFEKPERLACVRIFQSGGGKAEDFKDFKIEAVTPSGDLKPLNLEKLLKWVPHQGRWGFWNLYPTLPDEEPVLCKGVKVAPVPKLFQGMEVWVVAE